MTTKEFKIQFALGTLTPLKLFLKMLSMQNEDTLKSGDWDDNRNPLIEVQDDNGNIHVNLTEEEVVFVFNSKEEYIGTYNYK